MLPVYSAIVGFFLGLTISPSSALFLGLMLGLIAWAFTGFKIMDKRSSIANVANDDCQRRSEQKSPNNLKNLKAIDLGRTLALSLSISANASDSELDEARKVEIDIDKYRNEKFF